MNAEENGTLNASLRESLECPVCLEFSKPPIFVCSNGHHVCNKCQPSLQHCPTCREQQRPSTRCIALEKIADNVKLPCANKHEGCKVVLNAADMAVHWQTCQEVYVYECKVFIPNENEVDTVVRCDWKGNRRGLLDHVQTVHLGCYFQEESIRNKINITFNKKILYTRLVSAFGELFWVRLRHHLETRATYLWVTYVGDVECAAKYESRFRYISVNGRVKETICTQAFAKDEFRYTAEGALVLQNEKLAKFVVEGSFSFSVRIQKK